MKEQTLFLEEIFFVFFSGNGEIWEKSFAPPKICLLLHLCLAVTKRASEYILWWSLNA